MLPNPLEEVARKLDEYNKRLNHLERLENFESDIGARVFNNANISIPNAAWTALTFNSERWDTDNIHSTVINTGRLTCVTKGKYLIIGNGAFDGSAGGTYRSGAIRMTPLGQAQVIVATSGAYEPTTTDADFGVNVSTIIDMSVGDFVEFYIIQNSGGNLNCLNVSQNSPEFMMMKIG